MKRKEIIKFRSEIAFIINKLNARFKDDAEFREEVNTFAKYLLKANSYSVMLVDENV